MRHYTLFVLLLAATLVQGAIRTADEAAELAASCFNQSAVQKAGMRKVTANTLRLAATRYKDNQTDAAFYVFNREDNSGFAVISADDRTEDVLCISDEGSIDMEHLNPNFAWWLSRYQKEISSVTDEMAYTSTEKKARKAVQVTAISPLLGNIAWDQLTPYNDLCPIDPNDKTRSYTGCVATATAQVMAKWKYPTKGTGSKTYTCIFYDPDSYNEYTGEYTKKVGSESLSADFANTTYDWANMKDSYSGSYTKAQGNAVATLMYHCGVACEMSYGGDTAGGSGAYTDMMAVGLSTYFGYTYDKFITMYSKSDYGTAATPSGKTSYGVTRTNFETYFNQDLEAGRPIVMGGEGEDGGHEFVCDGRNSDGKFHINWGWSGEDNCYCALSSLKGGGYNFSSKLDAIIGLQPAVIDSVHVTSVQLSPTTLALDINQRSTLTATVLPTNATDKSVVWSSDNANIASVKDGVVRGVGTGQTIIRVTTVDKSFQATCNVTVSSTVLSNVDFSLVTNANELRAGDEVIFVGHNNKTYQIATDTVKSGKKSQYLSSVVIDVTDSTSISLDEDSPAAIFTLGGKSGAWTFTENKSGKLLGTSDAKYLLLGSGTTTWTIQVKAPKATISSTTTTYGSIYYNAANPRFTTYTSTTQTLPYMYVRHNQTSAVNNVQDGIDGATKVLINGVLYIRRGQELFDMMGRKL